MRILVWHVHGSWTTSFVHGPHTYLLPRTSDHGEWGRGRAQTWDWPPSAVEVPVGRLADEEVDIVVLQRPEEVELVARWLRRRPGRDVPAIYVEHNTPRGDVPNTRHPLAHRADIPLVHVTAFNALMWDSGRAPTRVIDHGVVDPGERYTGELERIGVAINEPVRRWRVTGTDLLPAFTRIAPLDVFGMGLEGLPARLGVEPARMQCHGDVPQDAMHTALARRRLYLHPLRWTSLGLSLIEAMCLGMPVVAVGATEAYEAVPPGAGAVSTRPEDLTRAAAALLADHDLARHSGKRAREVALERYGLDRFLHDWDALLTEAAP